MAELVIRVLLAVTCILAVCFLTAVIYLKYIHRKYAHIPGPPRTSFFTGNLSQLTDSFKRGGFFADMLLDWTNRYGHTIVIFILHQCLIITVDPDLIKEMLTTENHPKSKRSYKDIMHLYGQRFLGRGLVTEVDHAVWSKRRALMNPAFNRSVLKGLLDDFNTTADDLMEELAKKADGKTVISLLHEFNKATLDVIGKVAFGKDIDSIHDDHSPFPRAISMALTGFSATIRSPFPDYSPFTRKFRKDVREACLFIRNTGRKWLEERKAAMRHGEYTPDDILSAVINTEDNDSHHDKEKALDDIVTLFVAGQETTANSLGFILMELGRRPDVLNKLRTEIDKVMGSRSSINFDDIGKLHYASMVIKETLRMYPPVSLTFRTLTTDVKAGNMVIPEGSDIAMSTYASGRSNLLQEDPLTYKPERFDPDCTDRPSMYTVYPFSLGPRNCIGQTFAQIEMKVMLVKFLQRFNLELDPNQSFDMLETTTLRPKDGTRATLTIRGT